jgi:hypothetical protein
MKYIFAGDSWALKGFTEQNYHHGNNDPMPDDVRLADHWQMPYEVALAPGQGNLSVLDKILNLDLPPTTPVIWIYTEPGRDFGRITGKSEFDWIATEEIFEIRKQLDRTILKTIKQKLPNPVALIGGLSDIDIQSAIQLGYKILHPSWQQWIANKLESQWFKFGWGACDIGWRADHNNVKPSKAAVFAWDEQIKEWCWWEDQGYFCHEHPSPRANLEFAQYLQSTVENWLIRYDK